MSAFGFGDFFEEGQHWQRSIHFRVDDPDRAGFKRLVCGSCVQPSEAFDPGTSSGGHLCEVCDLPYGRPESHEAAIAIMREKNHER